MEYVPQAAQRVYAASWLQIRTLRTRLALKRRRMLLDYASNREELFGRVWGVYTAIERFVDIGDGAEHWETDPRYYDEAERQRRFPAGLPTNTVATGGSIHGEMVHRDILRFVNSLWATRIAYPPPARTAAAVLIVAKLCDLRILPLAGELEVGGMRDRDGLAIVTRVDLVAQNPNEKRLFLVEIKTGRDNERYGPALGDAVLPQFPRAVRCPLHHDLLQAAASVALAYLPLQRGKQPSLVVRLLAEEEAPSIEGVLLRVVESRRAVRALTIPPAWAATMIHLINAELPRKKVRKKRKAEET